MSGGLVTTEAKTKNLVTLLYPLKKYKKKYEFFVIQKMKQMLLLKYKNVIIS